MSGRIAA
jgi:hypothetical protein